MPNQDERNANELERTYERQRQQIQAKIQLLNQELQRLKFSNFDTISSDKLVELISEDSTIWFCYQQLKAEVAQVRVNIQTGANPFIETYWMS